MARNKKINLSRSVSGPANKSKELENEFLLVDASAKNEKEDKTTTVKAEEEKKESGKRTSNKAVSTERLNALTRENLFLERNGIPCVRVCVYIHIYIYR